MKQELRRCQEANVLVLLNEIKSGTGTEYERTGAVTDGGSNKDGTDSLSVEITAGRGRWPVSFSVVICNQSSVPETGHWNSCNTGVFPFAGKGGLITAVQSNIVVSLNLQISHITDW